MFVSNCDKLMAVKYLPDVLALIRVVREKFHCQFSRKEAKSVSALEIIARHAGELDLSQQRLTEMINSFTKSWNLAITSADCKCWFLKGVNRSGQRIIWYIFSDFPQLFILVAYHL